MNHIVLAGGRELLRPCSAARCLAVESNGIVATQRGDGDNDEQLPPQFNQLWRRWATLVQVVPLNEGNKKIQLYNYTL